MRFGAKLRELRLRGRMTLAEVASEIGWSPAYLSDIETSKKNPPREEAVRRLITIIGAHDQAQQLVKLSRASRMSISVKITVATDPEVGEAMVDLARAFAAGKVGIDLARGIKKLMNQYKATA
jgi:transcriptional regulator with XRE-family HTH domain